MRTELWQVDRSGFNVVEERPDGIATVAQLQPHERIKERARLVAAAPDLLEVAKQTLAQVTEGIGPPDWDWIREVIAKAEPRP